MQQPSSGNWFANATSSTPGIACIASTSLRCRGTRLPGSVGDRSRHAEDEGQDVIGVEAGRCAGEIPEVDDQDRADREQRERERDFGDDERLRHAPAARSGRRPRTVAEHVGRRRPRRLPERREAGQARSRRTPRPARTAEPSSPPQFPRRAEDSPPAIDTIAGVSVTLRNTPPAAPARETSRPSAK